MNAENHSIVRLSIALVIGLVLGSCAAAVEESQSEFTVELQDGQAWMASGDAADSGVMCPAGGRRSLWIETTEGRVLTTYEIATIFRKAKATKVDPDIVFVVEWTCADGSGSFTIREDAGTSTWTITSGRGAYRYMTGNGDFSFVPTLEAIPLNLHFEGTLHHPSR